jgi:hypothetical protein
MHTQQLSCPHPAMASNDLTLISDQNWIGKAECLNTFCDLSNLTPRMGSRIAVIGCQCGNWQIFDLKGIIDHHRYSLTL